MTELPNSNFARP